MNITYRDDSIVLVEKPGGLLSVPGRGPNKQDCVVTRIKNLFPRCIPQPAVHRLDMYTSGLMVLALTKESHRNISIQFERGQVNKKYMALLDGIVKGKSGKVVLSFRLDITNRPYQIYDPQQGKEGISYWKTIEIKDGISRIEFEPITGRTHQLRLHAAHDLGLGCPIVGDALYGKGKEGEKMMLHASDISFQHPVSKQTLVFASPPPF
ncbi:MAG: RluA family pseudouridine synthase [Bacteroidetes bacterium]|nr:RluA family pseudouridine synthase [Bacteroidota bacterium]